MQNRKVTFYEECLTLGRFLSRAEKEALYKYLLETKRNTYRAGAKTLLQDDFLTVYVANGEIQYGIEDKHVHYVAREINSAEFCPAIRKLSLHVPKFLKVIRLERFFAQAEVDILSNFPLPGDNQQPEGGFGINAIPFYDLKYYSNGRGILRGFLKKFENSNSEILTKLRTL
jgi:hypothetical protein